MGLYHHSARDFLYEVVIYTNGGTLSINDTIVESSQSHYGVADNLDITTGTSCYHEYGIGYEVVVSADKVIVENGGLISTAIAATANAAVETA